MCPERMEHCVIEILDKRFRSLENRDDIRVVLRFGFWIFVKVAKVTKRLA